MKWKLTTIVFVLGFNLFSSGQTEDKKYYQESFAEMLQMLNGQKPINYKRAVFLTENSYHKGRLNYKEFCNDINSTGQKLKSLIMQKGLEKYKTSGNWAVFTYMVDSIPANNFNPFTYDFVDFMGEKDRTKMFVTKLMKTKSGNCHSMPMYYKILCEEIGAKASLALAPNHLYIKHIDEKGQWTNVELTNGGFPRDQWIIKEMAITVEAIKSEAYMTPLTDKESIAMCMFDLANDYKFAYGFDDFVLKTANSALKYFPKCIPLLMLKANYYKTIGQAEQRKPNANTQKLKSNFTLYQQTVSEIDRLGYKEMPFEQYEAWVKSVEKEKEKRGLAK